LSKRLSLYKLRANVEIGEAPAPSAVFALWERGLTGPIALPGARSLSIHACHTWACASLRCLRRSGAGGATGRRPARQDDWHRHRIALGVPEAGRDYRLGDTFLHEANYDQLNGVSFSKGCFIGQEVASRMQHRGGGRKRVVEVEGAAALAPGAPDYGRAGHAWDRSVRWTAAVGWRWCGLDRAAEALAKGVVLSAEAVPVRLSKPAWAQFEMTPPARTEVL
jgi:folate-binding protein YgfZ